MYDEDYHIIVTGGCFGSMLRCFAVNGSHPEEGLLNEIITHLIDVQYNRGNLHLFLVPRKEQDGKPISDAAIPVIERICQTCYSDQLIS